MARKTFFSFHYKNDVWRANQVINSWVTKDEKEAADFTDTADFEKSKKKEMLQSIVGLTANFWELP